MTPSSGLLLIDKDAGATSHDAVAAVRRTLQVKRAGHAGTLDPMATGLLVVGLGGATRLLRFAQAGVKRYEGEALLGVATDSLDAQGAAVGRARVPDLDDATLAAAAAGFLGDIDQTPPMVSAVKVGGRRLYEIAREGREVERAARRVRVDSFDVSLVDTDRVRFAVTCSTGTYVRVLLAELAERLGTLGHLVALRRVASGSLRVEDAVSVARLAQLCADGAAPVRPAGDMVAHLARATLDADGVARVRHGQRVALDATDDEVAGFDAGGDLVAVLTRHGGDYQPTLVLSGVDDARG